MFLSSFCTVASFISVPFTKGWSNQIRRWVGHVSCPAQMTNATNYSVDRSRCRCEYIIKMDIKETECMCTGWKKLPHFIESEDTLLCPQGPLNPIHADKSCLIKIHFYIIILFLSWFPKQPPHFSFCNENFTCNSHFPCAVYLSRSYHKYRDKATSFKTC